MEANLCKDEAVIVVGGGNSAGQAAVFLSGSSSKVHLVVRGPGLAATMSDYLVQRILQSPRIELHVHTEITRIDGDDRVQRVTLSKNTWKTSETLAVGAVFVMIGAEPNTSWLEGCLFLDDKGFVTTGRDAGGVPLSSAYETTVPGIYAVGDVRSGSVKRVASSVGEGSVVVQALHSYLSSTAVADDQTTRTVPGEGPPCHGNTAQQVVFHQCGAAASILNEAAARPFEDSQRPSS